MILNYFKPIDELIVDFKELSISKQQQATNELFDRYLIFSRRDFKLIGKKTAQTENIWHLYRTLQDIFMERITNLNNH